MLDSNAFSRRRSLPLFLGVRRWDGFVYPELYVRDDAGLALRLLGRVVPVLLAPLLIPYFWAQRRHLGTRFADYQGRGSAFWNSSGPTAYLHSVADRLLRRPGRDYSVLAGDVAEQVIVVDGFYADPAPVRAAALAMPMTYYEKGWFTTAGVGATPPELLEQARARLADALGVRVGEADFAAAEAVMPGWNGAFHAKLSENLLATASCAIHNHAALGPDAWACVVYLNNSDQPARGTSVWSRRAGRLWLEPHPCFDSRVLRFAQVTTVAARFNRCVIMPAYALHRGEDGFGHDKGSARLFQTFFFVAPRAGRAG